MAERSPRDRSNRGTKGQIAYVGQLEDDLTSFVNAIHPMKPATLAGFSADGGFALRFAGSEKQAEFQNYLLLSPFLGRDAPNYRPDSGGWVSVGIPRIVAVSILNHLGIQTFNDLPVTKFALSEKVREFLTPQYSFALASNFGPQRDYEASIRAVREPVAVVAGVSDEAFFTDKLEGIFRKQGQSWPVTLLPGIAHIPLTLDPIAVRASVKAVEGMSKGGV